MSDQYPQVVEDLTRPVTYRVWSAADPRIGGRWKVVPSDAIVIEREDIDAYTVHRDGADAVITGPGGTKSTVPIADPVVGSVGFQRRSGLMSLALADYLAKHPPIDEAQVEAIAQALADDRADDTGIDWRDLIPEAERLYRLNVRIETSDVQP